jgi:predicted DNA-binding transcriptional regulator AlpA
MTPSNHLQRPPPKPSPLAIPESEAARLLSISPRTLWELRRQGAGPRHCMVGSSVRYAVTELTRYLNEKTEGRPS